MSKLGMRKVRILIIMTSPEREPPKTVSAKRSALRSPTGITHLGIYPVFIAIKGGGRTYTAFTSRQNASSHKFFPSG